MTAGIVALTGGTGFIGRYAAAALAAAGWRLRLLVRRDPTHPLLAGVSAELVLGDLGDASALAQLVDGAEAIVHVAGLTKARSRDAFLAVNRDGSARLAEAAARYAPAARCVLVSSLAARAPDLSSYAASKSAGEQAVRATPGGASWTILRPGVVYGPWDTEGRQLRRLAASRLAPVPRAPEPRIAMIHAADLAAAILAFCRDGEPGGTYELSDAKTAGYAWSEVLALTCHLLGRPSPRLVPLPDSLLLVAGLAADLAARLGGNRGVFGLGKAREILHRDWSVDAARMPPAAVWAPRIPLIDGMRETAAWWSL